MFTPKALPMSAVAALSFSFCGFVVLANFSLLLNSVGFYQVRTSCTLERRVQRVTGWHVAICPCAWSWCRS